MAWLLLLLAGLCEIVWSVTLKQTDGFTRLWPTVVTVLVMIVSFVLLAQAVRTLPLGTAYGVWTGIGAAGTAIYGMVALGESRDPARLGCLALLLAGIVGLKMLGGSGPAH
ncbi:MAG TPA: quaternary ammonium compound efflux SMR transporter SugE [Tepidisphaeraceae bacterium]|nr:quaternary ammonium compound efflux SMR transporter SugE [Tepidisphaeraceae bacterium]